MKIPTARNHCLWSKAGEPLTIAPAGISPWVPLWAVTTTPSPMLQCPATPTCPARMTFLPTTVEPARPTCAQSKRMLADRGAVPHLHQVVDFDAAADARFANAGAVDAGVGLDFDVVLQHRRAGLRDLLPAVSVAGEAKAVAADHRAVLQDDVVAQGAELAHHRMRVGEEVVADPGAAIDDDVRQQHSVVANLDVFVDDHVCADVGVRAELRA